MLRTVRIMVALSCPPHHLQKAQLSFAIVPVWHSGCLVFLKPRSLCAKEVQTRPRHLPFVQRFHQQLPCRFLQYKKHHSRSAMHIYAHLAFVTRHAWILLLLQALGTLFGIYSLLAENRILHYDPVHGALKELVLTMRSACKASRSLQLRRTYRIAFHKHFFYMCVTCHKREIVSARFSPTSREMWDAKNSQITSCLNLALEVQLVLFQWEREWCN